MLEWSEWPILAKAAIVAVGAAVLLAIWSVLSSTLFLLCTGLMGQHHGLPFEEWWVYWWFYGFHHPAVGLWLEVSAGLPIGVPLLLVAVTLARRGMPGGNRPLHGSTEWAKARELRENGLLAGFGGLFLGKVSARRYLRFGGPEHVACYAPTRSGKGVGLVIPNCLRYEASLVCLDVKKENFAATAGIRAKAGQRVILFDPLAPDGRTARYNPLSYVRRGTMDAIDDIQRIAGMLFPADDSKNAFFSDSARMAFVGATAYLAETEGADLSLGAVLRLFTSPAAAAGALKAMSKRAEEGRPYSEPCMTALQDYLGGHEDTVSDIRKTVTSKLGLWLNPRIDAATSASDFDLRELRHSLHAIYVGVTPDNIVRLRPLLSLFFQQLVDLTVQVLPQFDEKAKHQVLVLLDEFPLLGPMPVLADAFAYVAGYNMRIMLVMQSKAQLRDPALYGPDKAVAILDNCGVEVVFGTKSNELAKELSERLGYDTIEAISRSGPRFWRAFRAKSANQTESDQRRALLLPQEIIKLRPREAIVLRAGMHPCKVKRIRYFRDRFFKRLVIKPPTVDAIAIGYRSTPAAAVLAESAVEAEVSAVEATVFAMAPIQPPHGAEVAPFGSSVPPVAPALPVAFRAAEPPHSAEATPSTPAPAPEPQAAEAAPEPLPFEASAIPPAQADAFMAAICGADVDTSSLGLPDGKAFFRAVLGELPTKAPRKRKAAK